MEESTRTQEGFYVTPPLSFSHRHVEELTSPVTERMRADDTVEIFRWCVREWECNKVRPSVHTFC